MRQTHAYVTGGGSVKAVTNTEGRSSPWAAALTSLHPVHLKAALTLCPYRPSSTIKHPCLKLVEAPLIRLTVEPSASNSLREWSQVMVDKAMTVKRAKLGSRLGRLDDAALVAVNRVLALFLGFA